MRKLILALLVAATPSLAAVAHAQGDNDLLAPTDTYHRRVQRYAFGLAGNHADPHAVCRASNVSRVQRYWNAGDIAYTIFSFGLYTPHSIRVTCTN